MIYDMYCDNALCEYAYFTDRVYGWSIHNFIDTKLLEFALHQKVVAQYLKEEYVHSSLHRDESF